MENDDLHILTPKQYLFCREYLKRGGNGEKAAIAAGYSEKTARFTASENLTKPNIRAEIERLRANKEETLGLSVEMVLREHMKLAFNSIAHLHNTWIERKEFEELTDDQKECIAEISTQTRKVTINDVEVEVDFIKIKLFDKQKALDSISKIMGYDAPIKQQMELSDKRKSIDELFPKEDELTKGINEMDKS